MRGTIVVANVGAAARLLSSDEFARVRAKATAEVTTESGLRVREARSEGRKISDWNDFVANISQLDFDFQKCSIEAAARTHPQLQTPESLYAITALVYQSFLALCTETVSNTRLCELAIPLLEKGHLPCAWRGEYPQGDVLFV